MKVYAFDAGGIGWERADGMRKRCKTMPRERLRVIYLNWDGFAWDYYREVSRGRGRWPGLGRFTREGTIFTDARGGVPSLTAPMQTTLVTGAWPNIHGNTFRYLDRGSRTVHETGHCDAAETIAEALRRQDLEVGSVNQFTLLDRGTSREEGTYVDAGRGYRRRFAAAKKMIIDLDPDLLCLYIDILDAIGHNFTRGICGMRQARAEDGRRRNVMSELRRLDRELAALLAWLAPRGGAATDTALILTTDHGMTPLRGESSLPSFLAELSGAGFKPEVLGPEGRAAPQSDLLIVTAGLELQIFLVGSGGPEGKREAGETVAALVKRLDYVGGLLTRPELTERGAHPDFADLLLWPRPPHHFKTSPGPYPPRGQHDTLDASSSRVFLGMWGAGVKRGCTVSERAYITGVAPTIAALLGCGAPRNSSGEVFRAALRRGALSEG